MPTPSKALASTIRREEAGFDQSNNKGLVREFYTRIDHAGAVDEAAEKMLAPGFRFHLPGIPGVLPVAGLAEVVKTFFRGFPNLKHRVELQIAEGDLVATRMRIEGTHRGDFLGISSTNQAAILTVNCLHRVIDNRIAEYWLEGDLGGLTRGLVGGVNPCGVEPSTEG